MSKVFDYAIIGAGVAGLHLLHAMKEHGLINTKDILVIDKQVDRKTEQNLSYWESEQGKWDSIVQNTWAEAEVFSPKGDRISFALGAERYKSLRFSDFYEYIKGTIPNSNVEWKCAEVQGLNSENNVVRISLAGESCFAKKVFDSRHTFDIEQKAHKEGLPFVWQHFKGKKIKVDRALFEPSRFTMMDYRLRDGLSTSFIYVLPYSETEALVEFTYFSASLVTAEVYNEFIENYIHSVLKIESYEVTGIEEGMIPMTVYQERQIENSNIYKIGTAGSWVRPSSGYSFKYSEKYADCVAKNLKNGLPILNGVGLRSRHRFYDRLLLDILMKHNHLGAEIFTKLYSKNPIDRIFNFLDDKSSFMEELKLIARLKPIPFLKALLRQ